MADAVESPSMEIRRGLLVQGNEKLSAGVFHFDIPAVRTCPGRTRLCSRSCYATKSRYAFPQVRERLAWAYEQSKRGDFVDRMVRELYRKGVLLMRWHCAGDVYSPAYARKMLEVMARSGYATFWLYTRSWRVRTIFPLVQAMATLPNCRVWLSADAETGDPPDVPRNARVAWMATDADDDTSRADLVFLTRPLRTSVPLTMAEKVCPTDTPQGKERGTTCATCQFCWRD